MNIDQFNARLRELESMTGSEAGRDLFNEEYEALLHDVKRSSGPRYERFKRMQRLLFQQFMFLFGEWKREMAIEKIIGSGRGDVMAEGMN